MGLAEYLMFHNFTTKSGVNHEKHLVSAIILPRIAAQKTRMKDASQLCLTSV